MADDKVIEQKTYKINNVEVFSVGVWNGDKYILEDLYNLVKAFNSLKKGFVPYLKLGHDPKQKMAKSSGLPSVGWVENLFVIGDKLCADFNYIPEKVFKLIQSRAYRKVSCEIYSKLSVDGIEYDKVLGGIAFLGAENPGVMNLDDILGSYVLNFPYASNNFAYFEKEDNFKTYDMNLTEQLEDEMAEKSEKEVSLEAELEAQKKNFTLIEADKKKLEDEKTAIAKENEDLKKFKLEADAKALKAETEAAEAKRAQYVTSLESKKLVTPAMKDLVTEFMSDKKEYSIKETKHTRESLFEEILKLSNESAKVNFEESSKADYANKDKTDKAEEDIQSYMKENKCDYVQAYKAVMKKTT